MNSNKNKKYYQDFVVLCEELNIKSYTDELYTMISDNPDYFELIFPSGQTQKLANQNCREPVTS